MKNLGFSNFFIEKQSTLRLQPLIQHLLCHNDIAYCFFLQIDKHLILTTTKPLIQQGFLKSYQNTPTKGKSLKDLPFQSVKEPQFLLSENWGSGIAVAKYEQHLRNKGVVAISFGKRAETAPMFAEMQEGIRYATKEWFLGKLILMFGLFIFLCVPAGFLVTLYVSRYYGDTYFHMTFVEVIRFLGMMAGDLLISSWSGFKRHTTTLLVRMMSFGLLVILMGLAKNSYVYLGLLAVYGFALTTVQIASTTLLQENSELEMAGRIFGLFGAAYSSFLPIGMVVFDLPADRTSMRLLMVASGGLLILMATVMFLDKSFYRHDCEKEA